MALKDIDLKNMSLSDLKGMSLPKVKVSSRVISIIVIILSALVFYWMYSTKLPEIRKETEDLKNANIPLAATEQNLNKMYANMTFYIDETARLQKEYNNAINQFPPYMYLEDKVNFVNQLRNGDFKGYGMLEELTYGESSYVSAGGEDSANLDEEGTSLELYAVPISGKFVNISYANLKSFMTYGLTSNRRFVLDSITVHQSDDGAATLSCDFSFKTFFLSGQDRPYEYSGSIGGNNTTTNKDYLNDPVKNPFGLP